MQKRAFKRYIFFLFLIFSILLITVLCFSESKRNKEQYKNLTAEELLDSVNIGNKSGSLNCIGLVKMDEGKYAAFLPNNKKGHRKC